MKPHLKHFLFLFLTLIPFIIKAQVLKSMAVKMGLSTANQKLEFIGSRYTETTEVINGGFCAAELEFLRGKTFRFSSEFSYCQKGYQVLVPITSASQPDGTGAYKRIKNKFDYMSFSPQLTIRNQGDPLSPYIGIGPRVDYLFTFRTDGVKQSTSNINSTVFGLNVFTGVEYQLNDVGLFFEAKYMHDFTHASDQFFFMSKNRALILTLGVRINLTDK